MPIEGPREWIASHRRPWIVGVASVLIVVVVGTAVVGGGPWTASETRPTNETTVSNATFPTPTPTPPFPTIRDTASDDTTTGTATSSEADESPASDTRRSAVDHPATDETTGPAVGYRTTTWGADQPPAAPHAPAAAVVTTTASLDVP